MNHTTIPRAIMMFRFVVFITLKTVVLLAFLAAFATTLAAFVCVVMNAPIPSVVLFGGVIATAFFWVGLSVIGTWGDHS